ncbi:MAG: ribosome-associated translation inhibitor RaiA [Actinomycetota bacterium]
MQLQVKGKNVAVTDALFSHAERKLGKIARYLPPWDELTQVELELSVERNRSIDRSQTAEVTVWTKGPILRARESAPDMYAAIDLAAHKLERQVGRYRKRQRRHRDRHEPTFVPESLPVLPEEPEEDEGTIRIVKSKSFDMKPMTPEDAVMRMDLLHHDFYVFRNADDGVVNVVYRRQDGDYGLIAPD